MSEWYDVALKKDFADYESILAKNYEEAATIAVSLKKITAKQTMAYVRKEGKPLFKRVLVRCEIRPEYFTEVVSG